MCKDGRGRGHQPLPPASHARPHARTHRPPRRQNNRHAALFMLRASAATPSRLTSLATTDGEGELNASEYMDILAKRVAFSRAHTLLCGTVIAAGVIEVLWILLPSAGGVGQLPHHRLFVFIEGYVTLGLLGEIALRLILERGAFCQQRSNLFDVSVALLSVLSSALYAIGMETPVEMVISEMIVLLRIAFRLLRLLSLTKGFQRHQQAADRKLELEVRLCDEDASASAPSSPGGGELGSIAAHQASHRSSNGVSMV